MLPLTGFLPATHPRMRATIDAIQRDLTSPRGLVYRYRGTDDGLAGTEGTFLLCTFWLARCLALAGDVTRARAVFETATGYANDVGLLAEEIDPHTGEMLGNYPQAFSHIGLINAAWTIAETEGPPLPETLRCAQAPHRLGSPPRDPARDLPLRLAGEPPSRVRQPRSASPAWSTTSMAL